MRPTLLLYTEDNSYISKLVNEYDNLIISRTLSKFYGLPGLRMGFGFISKGLEKFIRYSNKYLGYNRYVGRYRHCRIEIGCALS